MAKHAKPIVVRLWPDGYTGESINAFVGDWNRGQFTLPIGHPLAQAARGCHKRTFVLTVLDTDELEWQVETVSTAPHHSLITCRPRRDMLRQCLRIDDYLIEQGQVA
jgi:hypothetical protein